MKDTKGTELRVGDGRSTHTYCFSVTAYDQTVVEAARALPQYVVCVSSFSDKRHTIRINDLSLSDVYYLMGYFNRYPKLKILIITPKEPTL